jgi:hypothetical protein
MGTLNWLKLTDNFFAFRTIIFSTCSLPGKEKAAARSESAAFENSLYFLLTFSGGGRQGPQAQAS